MDLIRRYRGRRVAAVVSVLLLLGCGADDTEVTSLQARVGEPSREAALPSIVRISAFGCGAPALGSGFAVEPDLIVTSGHLVTGRTPDETTVIRPDGTEYPAALVAFDEHLDLALLRVDEPVFEPVELLRAVPDGDGVAWAVRGEDGIEGIDFDVDAPVIVNWDGVFRDTESSFHGIRLNAEIKRGDSGSGLFIADKQVIGLVHSTNRAGLPRGYAVSARQIDDYLAEVDTSAVVEAPRCA